MMKLETFSSSNYLFVFADYIFSGSDNALMLSEMMTIDFTCQFSLTYYPFDKQLCSLVYKIEDAEQDIHIYKVIMPIDCLTILDKKLGPGVKITYPQNKLVVENPSEYLETNFCSDSLL